MWQVAAAILKAGAVTFVLGVIVCVIVHSSWGLLGSGAVGFFVYLWPLIRARHRERVVLLRDPAEPSPNPMTYRLPGHPPDDPPPSLQELKARRAELVVRKRAVGQDMRAVRDAARLQRAKVGTKINLLGTLVFGSSTLRRLQRSGIRLTQEEVLLPLQQERNDIDREIGEIDRQIVEAKNQKRG